MTWDEWRAEVQQRSGMSDKYLQAIEADARGAFQAGISPATYADLSD
ncbi:hypothetical protein FHT44_005035 [Mycolicibacterium sp. BK634]|nr:hypothetical protein [Mycolicibacterium sp. BK634]